jgi:hypothetical protein
MVARCSSEMLVDLQWAASHYIPEDRNLHENEYLLNCNLPAGIHMNYPVQWLESESTPGGSGEMLSSTDKEVC